MEEISTQTNTNKLTKFHCEYNSIVIRLTLPFIIRYLASGTINFTSNLRQKYLQ